MKEEKKIIMLPAKESIYHLCHNKLLIVSIESTGKSDLYKSIPQHFYILSDEEVKEGDWVLGGLDGKDVKKYGKYFAEDWAKIIATTDPKLIADGIPHISEQLIKDQCIPAYNKYGKVDMVEVEYGKSCDLDIYCQFAHKGEECRHEDIIELNPDGSIACSLKTVNVSLL